MIGILYIIELTYQITWKLMRQLVKIQYLIFLILLLGCQNRQASQTACNEIKQIIITDKFTKTSTNKKSVFTDSTTLTSFCREIKLLQTVTKEPIVRANFGF